MRSDSANQIDVHAPGKIVTLSSQLRRQDNAKNRRKPTISYTIAAQIHKTKTNRWEDVPREAITQPILGYGNVRQTLAPKGEVEYRIGELFPNLFQEVDQVKVTLTEDNGKDKIEKILPFSLSGSSEE